MKSLTTLIVALQGFLINHSHSYGPKKNDYEENLPSLTTGNACCLCFL